MNPRPLSCSFGPFSSAVCSDGRKKRIFRVILPSQKDWTSWEEGADRNNVLRTRIWRNVVSADEWWPIVLYRSTVRRYSSCAEGARQSKTPHKTRDGCDAMRQGRYQDSASFPSCQKLDHNFPIHGFRARGTVCTKYSSASERSARTSPPTVSLGIKNYLVHAGTYNI